MGQVSKDHSGLFQLFLTPHTHDSHSEHEGQNNAQWEADDVIHDCIHNGSKGLPAGSSQDSTIDTLGGRQKGWELSYEETDGGPHATCPFLSIYIAQPH